MTSERSPLLEDGRQLSCDRDNGTAEPSYHTETKISISRGFAITSAFGLMIFLQAANMSLLTTMQSPIADDLDAYAEVSWFSSVYLIAMSSITPLAGRLCQIFSPRAYLATSAVIFTAGLALTAWAPTLTWFLFGRAVAGIGASGNFPAGIIVIVEMVKTERKGLFMGLLNSGFTLGVASGAVFAGALEPSIGWRGVFGVQVPLALLNGVLVYFALPRGHSDSTNELTGGPSLARKLAEIDYVGMVLLVSFIVLFLFGFSSPLGIQPVPIGVSLIVLATFLFVEIKVAKLPTIPVKLLSSRATLMTCFSTVFLMMSRWSVLFFTPVYATAVRAWPPARAGTLLLATNAGFAAGGLLVGWLHIRRAGNFFFSSLISCMLFAGTLYILGLTSTQSAPIRAFLLTAFANGLCTGAVLNYTVVHLLHMIDPLTHSVATSMVATFRGFAGSFGSSIGGGIFARVLRKALEDGFASKGMGGKGPLIRRLIGSPRLVNSLQGPEREVAVHGYESAVRTLFISASALAVIATVAQACTGWKKSETSESSESDVRPVDNA